MLTETKLFLFLLLSGAIATECVVPKNGGKYYIKLKGKDNYSYAFGSSKLANASGYDQLKALTGYAKNGNDILNAAATLKLQEFTFKNNGLFSEIEGEDKKPVEYVVGLKQQGQYVINASPVWDGKLYVAQATVKTKYLRSSKVELIGETIVIGGGLTKKAQVVFTKEEGNVYAPAQGKKVEILNANDSKICFVTETTANNDYVEMMTKQVLEDVKSKKIPETKELMNPLNARIKETAKVPFDKKKQVLGFLSDFMTYNKALKDNSADIEKIIKEKHCEKTEAEIRELALLDIKPKEKFNLEKITKLIMKHAKKETTPKKPGNGDNTSDNADDDKIPKDTPHGRDDSQDDTGTEDPSGAKSFATATTLVAILFFL